MVEGKKTEGMKEVCLILKIVLVCLLVKAPLLFSQEGKSTPPDTVRVNTDFPVVRTTPILPDTSNVVRDSVAVKPATSGIDSIITYSARTPLCIHFMTEQCTSSARGAFSTRTSG